MDTGQEDAEIKWCAWIAKRRDTVKAIIPSVKHSLRKCLKDEDPYVRKTAAVSVAKLHDINSQLVEEQGMFTDRVIFKKETFEFAVWNTVMDIRLSTVTK